jgi:hypothetical protein
LFLKGAPGQLPSAHLQNRSGPLFSSFAGAATPARHDDSQPIGMFSPNNHGPPTTPSSGFPPPPCHHQSIEKRTSLCPTNHPINRPLSPHSLPVRMRPARRQRFGGASNPAKALVTPILRGYIQRARTPRAPAEARTQEVSQKEALIRSVLSNSVPNRTQLEPNRTQREPSRTHQSARSNQPARTR